MDRSRRHSGGFTLIELAMVVAIIAVILALALPNLMPALAYGRLEGSARHLANYGRAAVARAAVTRVRHTVMIDTARGEYWVVQWKEVKKDKDFLENDEGLFGRGRGRSSRGRLFDRGGGESRSFFDRNRASTLFQAAPGLASVMEGMPEDGDEKAFEMQERFNKMAEMSLLARANNVKRDSFFDKEFTLKDFSLDPHADDEEEGEEVKEDLLTRSRIADGVRIDSVRVGNEIQNKGLIEIDVTPLGLNQPVTFYLRGEDGDYYTVVWDAITGGAHLRRGRVEL